MAIRGARRGTWLGAALLGAVALGARPAEACGGFFCSAQQPVNQAAERIIFADNGDGTITAVIQILYEGPSEQFSWLLPISSVPAEGQLDVASDIAFQRLQQATNPLYTLTTRIEGSCREDVPAPIPAAQDDCGTNPFVSGCGNGAGVSVAASGLIGAFEWTVIEVEPTLPAPADAALEWLTANGYDVPPNAAAVLGPYLADGMYLLALKLTKGSSTGSIRPIVLTYEAEAPMIPIKPTAVAANDDMGVMTWVLSDARAVPFNYSALELNEARIDWFNGASNYNQVVTEAADAAGGQGFVTEYAGPTGNLGQVIWQESDEAFWQEFRTRTYSSFGELFRAAWFQYGSWDGFTDVLRTTVTLPDDVSPADLEVCPDCYADLVTLSPTEFFAAMEASVIEPMRRVQALLDRSPYMTRLYSTLSASEMTVDPVFVSNAELPDVSNVHNATRVIECDASVYFFGAPWRIELPQGGVIRGGPEDVGQWPDATATQPANLRVWTLGATGDGALLEDNSEEISVALDAYNETRGTPLVATRGDDGCALGGPAGDARGLFAALLGLFGVLTARRGRRR